MERWKNITYMVAIYMFLIELRPLEPYMTAYQTGPDGNISLFEVKMNQISILQLCYHTHHICDLSILINDNNQY